MNNFNPYEVLGIKHNATLQEIKAAYKKRAFDTHPDKKNGNSDEFIKVYESYQILANQNARVKYDESKTEPHATHSYKESNEFLLAWLASEASLHVASGMSSYEVCEWLGSQGCPKSIIIEFERSIRTNVKNETRKGGRRFSLLHIGCFAASILSVVIASHVSSGLGSLVFGVLFFTYWRIVIPNILIGLGAAIFGIHPLSWNSGLLKFLSYLPLIILVWLVLLSRSK